MTTVGIVTELDPFHNGHAYLLRQAKAITCADAAVTVMSGSFVQRGMPAMLSKSARAECAVLGGFDAVLELPVTFALSPAERFAFGAVSVLDGCGVVTHLAFGSESGDIDAIAEAARVVCLPEVVGEIREIMKTGLPYARARRIAAGKRMGERASVLDNPNDILGVEYVKAIRKLSSGIKPVAVRRVGAGHGAVEPCGEIASGSFIRGLVREGKDVGNYVPEATKNVLDRERKNGGLRYADDRTLVTMLRRMTAEDFSRLPEVREGMENRLFSAAAECVDLDGFVKAVSCKRYTEASVRRIVMYAAAGLTADNLPQSPGCVRILGAGPGGREVLREIKRNSRLPVITKAADGKKLLESEIRADRVASAMCDTIPPSGEEFKKTPFFTKYLTESKNKS